jgi:LPXTG-motif cell wall-anchored protein
VLGVIALPVTVGTCDTATKTWETPTPTVLAATATPTPTIAALPSAGGTPSDGGSNALPWLAAIAGAIALIGGGAWFAYQRRRAR